MKSIQNYSKNNENNCIKSCHLKKQQQKYLYLHHQQQQQYQPEKQQQKYPYKYHLKRQDCQQFNLFSHSLTAVLFSSLYMLTTTKVSRTFERKFSSNCSNNSKNNKMFTSSILFYLVIIICVHGK